MPVAIDEYKDYEKYGELQFKHEFEIEYVHSLKELYKRIYIWLGEDDWLGPQEDSFYETLFWQRAFPEGKIEHHIWWRAWRHPGLTGFEQKEFTFFLKFNFQTLNVSRSEIMDKGTKWNLWQANTILRYEAYLIHNYRRDFENSGLLKGLANRFRLWIYKPRVKELEDELAMKMVNLTNVIKAFTDTQVSPQPVGSIFPKHGIP